MLAGGAPIDFTDGDGWGALHFAAAEGTPELCELLVEKGLKADAAARDGETPVDLAEEEEHDEAVASAQGITREVKTTSVLVFAFNVLTFKVTHRCVQKPSRVHPSPPLKTLSHRPPRLPASLLERPEVPHQRSSQAPARPPVEPKRGRPAARPVFHARHRTSRSHAPERSSSIDRATSRGRCAASQ